jgi:hypothetical protein
MPSSSGQSACSRRLGDIRERRAFKAPRCRVVTRYVAVWCAGGETRWVRRRSQRGSTGWRETGYSSPPSGPPPRSTGPWRPTAEPSARPASGAGTPSDSGQSWHRTPGQAESVTGEPHRPGRRASTARPDDHAARRPRRRRDLGPRHERPGREIRAAVVARMWSLVMPSELAVSQHGLACRLPPAHQVCGRCVAVPRVRSACRP